MRKRRTMIGLIVLVVCGCLLLWLSASPTRPTPPVLTLLKVERVSVADDNGAAMWLAYILVSNASPATAASKGLLFFKGRETRSGNRWLQVSGPTPLEFRPGEEYEWPVLFPAHVVPGQLRFKYTGASPLFGGESWRGGWRRLADRMPSFVQRLFWRQLSPFVDRTPRYVPSSNWHEIVAEFPLPPDADAQSRAAATAGRMGLRPSSGAP
jgi:hypothetical protein